MSTMKPDPLSRCNFDIIPVLMFYRAYTFQPEYSEKDSLDLCERSLANSYHSSRRQVLRRLHELFHACVLRMFPALRLSLLPLLALRELPKQFYYLSTYNIYTSRFIPFSERNQANVLVYSNIRSSCIYFPN